MNWLQLHPDGIVYIRDADDAALYEARLEGFASDYGAPFPLPEPIEGRPVVQLRVFEGTVHAYDSRGNELTVDGRIVAAPYQAIVDALPSLSAARAARESPPPDPRQEILQQLEALDYRTRTSRGLRELAIIASQLNERLRSSAALADLALPSFADNVGIVKAQEAEQQAAVLRAQLAALAE